MAMKFEIKNLCCGYGKTKIIDNLSLTISKGEILCILGPNGVGKTTLFKTILGFLNPLGGDVIMNDENIHEWNKKKSAQYLAYVPQAHIPPFPFTVFDVVLMGRTAYMDTLSGPSKKDMEASEHVLGLLDIYHLKDRIYTEEELWQTSTLEGKQPLNLLFPCKMVESEMDVNCEYS